MPCLFHTIEISALGTDLIEIRLSLSYNTETPNPGTFDLDIRVFGNHHLASIHFTTFLLNFHPHSNIVALIRLVLQLLLELLHRLHVSLPHTTAYQRQTTRNHRNRARPVPPPFHRDVGASGHQELS